MMYLLYIYCKERGMKSEAWEKVKPSTRSCDQGGGRKKGWLTNTISMMCKQPAETEDVSNHKRLIEQRQKEPVGMTGKGIGHEGHHKGVIWCDNDEIIILKIERNDKYYTF